MINAEIITIGNEIIFGDIVNTNSVFISKKLKNAGIDCKYHDSVGDNYSDIAYALLNAFDRSNLIIVTGGLGPTDDDITIECASKALGLDLEFREDIFEEIKQFFKKNNRPIPEINKKQAYAPKGALVVKNESGTAPMVVIKKDKKHIIFLPGVPAEINYFFEKHLTSFLESLAEHKIVSRVLKFSGISEATINEKIEPIIKDSKVEIAFLPTRGETTLKLTVKNNSMSEIKKTLDDKEKEILEIIGEHFYGRDGQEIEEILSEILLQNNISISSAESCTGGLLSKYLTDIPGSSAYVSINVVTYSNEMKTRILGVKPETLSEYGAVSEQTAKEMAQGIKKLSNSDYGISITGIAGPGGATPEKPVGLVFIALASDKDTYVLKMNYQEQLPRAEIRLRAATKSLHFAREIILKELKSQT